MTPHHTIALARYGLDYSHPWSLDATHAEFLKTVIQTLRPATVVEVGCHLGISTLAILEAGAGRVILIDPQITPTVAAMAADYGATVYAESSATALPKLPPCDDMLIFFDGDHSYAAVSEEWRLVTQMRPPPRAILSHDVTAPLFQGPSTEGCLWLWHTLQASGWLCFVDALPRPGQATARGFLVATRTLADHTQVIRAWHHTPATSL